MQNWRYARLRVMDVDLVGGDWLDFVSNEHGNTKTCNSRKVPVHAKLRQVLADAIAGRNGDELLFADPHVGAKSKAMIPEHRINNNSKLSRSSSS